MTKDFYKDFGGDIDTFVSEYSLCHPVTYYPTDLDTFDKIFERL